MQHSYPARRRPARNLQQPVVRLGWCLIAVLAAACSDAPPTAAKLTPPDSALKDMPLPEATDWYDCASWDKGKSWYCSWSHTEWKMPDWWDYPNEQWVTTTRDCQSAASAAYCDSQLFGPDSPYPGHSPSFPEHDYPYEAPYPTCPPPPDAKQGEKAYCAGKKLTTTQKDRARAALERMKALGGVCEELADIGLSLLSRDSLTIRTFPQSTFGMSGEASFGGALPHNGGPTGPKAWFVIANHMFNAYDEAHAYQPNPARNQPYKITLQWSLAHELEHLLGKNHIYRANGQRDDFRNPNTMQCSDVPNQPDW